jgi:catechol 2,3-dioxygenase-like lactoylglutathione lyase family enzyme
MTATPWSGSSAAILPVSDLDRSVAFYRDLGFGVEVADVGGYAFVEAGGIRLHLSAGEGFDPLRDAAMVYLYVDDVDAVHSALALPEASSLSHDDLVDAAARGESLARVGRIRDEPWGMREFALFDPDNNLLRVGGPLARSGR